jgi:hypothetical protein
MQQRQAKVKVEEKARGVHLSNRKPLHIQISPNDPVNIDGTSTSMEFHVCNPDLQMFHCPSAKLFWPSVFVSRLLSAQQR